MPTLGIVPVEDRRTFVGKALTGIGCAIAAALFLPALRYVFSPRNAGKNDEWIAVADLEKISMDRPVRVEFARRVVDGWVTSNESASAWVYKTQQGSVVAFAPQCTHLGCAYFWDDSREDFNCPCHGSRFAKDGRVTQGPASRSLDRYATRIEGRQLLIQPVLLSMKEDS